mgnify:CR=1 FL=1
MQTVEELRAAGYKVRVCYYRAYADSFLDPDDTDRIILLTRYQAEKEGLYNSLFGPLQKCGKTVVEVRSPTGVEVVGESLCSAKDQFSRKLGRKVALGRAMTKLLNSNQEV